MVGQRMMKNRRKFIKSRDVLASLLFPTRCPVCDDILEPEEIEKGIHLVCESKIYPVQGAVCMHCGKPLASTSKEFCFDCSRLQRNIEQLKSQTAYPNHKIKLHTSSVTQVKSLYLYRGAIKHTMYKFKYSNKREYARFFAKQAVERLGWWLGVESPQHTSVRPDIIIPVPMYEPKKRTRGYNQAESFAEELSRLTGIPVDKKLVKRVKDTTPQKSLNPEERKNNLKSAFQIQKNSVQYSHALVVDDIYTTGSTAEAVAQELIKKGVRQVYVLTVCIGGDI